MKRHQGDVAATVVVGYVCLPGPDQRVDPPLTSWVRVAPNALLSLRVPAFALGVPALAKVSAPASEQSAGYFKFTVGAAKLTVVSDGHFTTSARDIGINADENEIAAFMEAHFLDATSHYEHTNHVVIELGDSKVLVDVGSGNRVIIAAHFIIQSCREDNALDCASNSVER